MVQDARMMTARPRRISVACMHDVEQSLHLRACRASWACMTTWARQQRVRGCEVGRMAGGDGKGGAPAWANGRRLAVELFARRCRTSLGATAQMDDGT